MYDPGNLVLFETQMTRSLARRQFFQISASALAAVTRPISSVADAANPVVVVGGGLAGLRAADLLRKSGRKVIVLEARSEAGGRVRTIRSPFDNGLYAEAGPIRIAGAHRAVLRLVRDFGLTLAPFSPPTGNAVLSIGGFRARATETDGLALSLSPEETGLDPGAMLQRRLGDLSADLADPAPTAATYAGWRQYDSMNWPDFLRSRGASAGAVKLMTLGGDSSELSALYVLRQYALLKGSSQYYKIRGGMDLLPRAMAADLGDIVHYDAAVTGLDQRADHVRIDYLHRGAKKSIRADRVILAIPFSTLRQVTLHNSLSMRKRQTIDNIVYFPATRLLLQAKRRFWRDSGQSGTARTDRPAEMWDCTHDLPGQRGILGATVGGAVGRTILGLSADAAIAFGIDTVAGAFPGIRAEFEKGAAQIWATEPWSRGAFAVFRPGQMTAMMPEIALPEGRIHFAGEHTSSWMGWMEGAVLSGERAAREVIAA